MFEYLQKHISEVIPERVADILNRIAIHCTNACMQVVRSSSGETRAYPLVDAVQKDSICYTTLAPAAVPLHTAAAAQALASQVSFIDAVHTCDAIVCNSVLW
jgi:phosphoribosylaminoimidazole carboxylase (NCAIR synthetase)